VKKFLNKTIEWAHPYLTWKMLPFLLIAWCLTNGWSYAFVVVGTRLDIKWMVIVGGAWISFLWAPFTLEKWFTVLIAGWLYKLVYKKEFKNKKEVG
jgi:hypothetical protein